MHPHATFCGGLLHTGRTLSASSPLSASGDLRRPRRWLRLQGGCVVARNHSHRASRGPATKLKHSPDACYLPNPHQVRAHLNASPLSQSARKLMRRLALNPRPLAVVVPKAPAIGSSDHSLPSPPLSSATFRFPPQHVGVPILLAPRLWQAASHIGGQGLLDEVIRESDQILLAKGSVGTPVNSKAIAVRFCGERAASSRRRGAQAGSTPAPCWDSG